MNKKLEAKITELFEYRKFPQLFKKAGQKYKKHEMIPLLMNLQSKIYDLDCYLEQNWEIKKMDLNVYWREIRKALTLLGVKRAQQSDFLKQIQKYQEHELALREGLLPKRFSLEYYYFYKSCDVKLLRKIIYKSFTGLGRIYSVSDWRYFDLITEVNDDIVDLKEDTKCINGNAYLLSIMENGLKKTTKLFNTFLDDLDAKNDARLEKVGAKYKKLHAWTALEIKSTKKELKKNLKSMGGKKNKKKFRNCAMAPVVELSK